MPPTQRAPEAERLVEEAPAENVWRAVQLLATESEAPEPPTQLPAIEKQPEVRLIPPLPKKVEVPVVKLVKPWIAKSEPGEEVPIPTEPVLVTIRSVLVVEPIANSGIPTAKLLTLMEKPAQGEVVPIPRSEPAVVPR